MHYLIVEDDPNLRLLWRTILSDRGNTVTEANSVAVAEAALAKGGIDAVVLDLYLGRENGLSLAELAGESNPGCKVVIVSGSAELREAEIRAATDSVIAVHRKPVDIEDLMASFALIDLALECRTA